MTGMRPIYPYLEERRLGSAIRSDIRAELQRNKDAQKIEAMRLFARQCGSWQMMHLWMEFHLEMWMSMLVMMLDLLLLRSLYEHGEAKGPSTLCGTSTPHGASIVRLTVG
jgi:hypothetical protein